MKKKTSSSIVEIQLHTKHKTSKTKHTAHTHTHTNELFLNWCHFKWLNPLRILIDLNWWVSSLDLLYFYLCSFTSFVRMPFFHTLSIHKICILSDRNFGAWLAIASCSPNSFWNNVYWQGNECNCLHMDRAIYFLTYRKLTI